MGRLGRFQRRLRHSHLVVSQSNVSAVFREVVIAERPAYDIAAAVPAVSIERVIAEGPEFGFGQVLREAVVSDEVVREILAATPLVVREVVMYEGLAYVRAGSIDRVVDLPGDPVTVVAKATHFSSAVLQQRDMPHPNSYLSPMNVTAVVQISAQRLVLDLVRGPAVVNGAVLLAAMSRIRAYTAVGEIRARVIRHLTAQQRDPGFPEAFRIVASTHLLTAQAFPRPIYPTANWVAQARLLTAQTRVYVNAESPRYAGTLVELTAQHRTVEPPFTQGFVAQAAQLAAQAFVPGPAFGPMRAAQVRLLAAAQRDLTPFIGQEDVGQSVQLAAQRRPPDAPRSPTYAAQARQLSALHRITPDPAVVLGVNAVQARQLTGQDRTVLHANDVHSPTHVSSVRVIYALGRDTVPPDEVEVPEIGCHVFQFVRLNASFRYYPPPMDEETNAVVRLAVQSVVLGDEFEAPTVEPDNPALVHLLGEVVVLADMSLPGQAQIRTSLVDARVVLGDEAGWVDPYEPVSTLRVLGTHTCIALGDTSFPPAGEALTQAQVGVLDQQVVLGDATFPPAGEALTQARVDVLDEQITLGDTTFPPAGEALSLARALGAAGHPVLGDTTFTPAGVPLSVATVSRLHQAGIYGDVSLYGTEVGGQMQVRLLAESSVMRDTRMDHMPRLGRRPVVTVTITD